MQFSGIILAGGQSSRMGKDKKTLIINKKTFLEHTYDILKKFCNDILICGLENDLLQNDSMFTKDIHPGKGPLGGIYTGLKHIKNSHAIILPVDMPLVNGKVIQHLIDNYNSDKDIAVFEVAGKIHPLVGIYKKSLIPLIEHHILNNKLKMLSFIKTAKYQRIPYNRPETFINVNNPSDYNRLIKIIENEK